MKKIILKPKAIMLIFLFFGIFVILVPTVVILAAAGTNPTQSSFGLTHYGGSNYRTYSGEINLLKIGINNNTCFQNTDPNKDYFLPYNTWDEWYSFELAVWNGQVPNVTTVQCCDNNPSNIYYNAGYYTDHLCGQSFPGCYLSNNGYTAINEGDTGAVCWSGNWRSTKCGTLFKSKSICNGDSCVNGIDASDPNNPKFCTGVYDSLSKICVYTSSVTVSVPNNSPRFYPFNTPYTPYGETTAGSWGSCATHAVCGNSMCESGYGEDCSTCPTDCGSCPPDCSLYPKMSMCNAVPGCLWTINVCAPGGMEY